MVDMFRLPKIPVPIETTTRLVRDGLRIKVIEAEFFSGGTSMARASCRLLRKTENAPGNVWSPPNWDAPAPEVYPAPTDPRLGMNGQNRPRGRSSATWVARLAPALDERSARARRRRADDAIRSCRDGRGFASLFRECRRPGLGYINSDVTIYLGIARARVSRWIGFLWWESSPPPTASRSASAGLFYDEKGLIGTSTVAALAQRKPMTNPPPPWSPAVIASEAKRSNPSHRARKKMDFFVASALANDGGWTLHLARCRAISGRGQRGALLRNDLGDLPGAKFKSTKADAVLATSRYARSAVTQRLIATPSSPVSWVPSIPPVC